MAGRLKGGLPPATGMGPPSMIYAAVIILSIAGCTHNEPACITPDTHWDASYKGWGLVPHVNRGLRPLWGNKMARVKGRLGGINVAMDKAQAAQLGIDRLVNGQTVPTGMIDPTQISAAPQLANLGNEIRAGVMDTVGGIRADVMNRVRPVMDRAAELRKRVAQFPTNMKQQKTMFDTVRGVTKSNPTADILNKDPNAWKNLQKKFGITEV